MATFLGLGTSVLFGNTVRASTELLTDFIAPIEPNDTITIDGNVVIDGNVSSDAINMNVTETNIGVGAGVTTLGQENTFVGASTGAANTIGGSNVFVGQESGKFNTTGSANTFLGNTAGENNTSGDDNVFVGAGAGRFVTTGQDNVFVGLNAGVDIVTGSRNVCLGFSTRGDAALDGCVLIGHDAGENNTTDDRLMIDNTNTNEPLIDGDFAANTLQINGAVTLGTDGSTPVHRLNTTVVASPGLAVGAGEAPPANPVTWLEIHINGTTDFYIPLYQ